jgi:hypothetical protein
MVDGNGNREPAILKNDKNNNFENFYGAITHIRNKQ